MDVWRSAYTLRDARAPQVFVVQLEKSDKSLSWGRIFTPEYYVRMAEAGNLQEQMNLAMQADHRGDVVQSFKWWKKAADEV